MNSKKNIIIVSFIIIGLVLGGIFVFTKQDKAFIEKLVEDFLVALKATEYQVACGIAEYLPGDDIEKVITLSDERMYSHKVKLKNSESFKKI